MKQVLRLTGMDDMLIGPFDTFEDAQRWMAASVFADGPHEIQGIVEPRPDHRKTSGPRPRRTEYSPAKNALMDMAEHFITLDPASKPGLRRMLDNYRVANVRGLAESDIAAFQTAMVEFAKSRGIELTDKTVYGQEDTFTIGRSPAERESDRENLEWQIETMKQGKP